MRETRGIKCPSCNCLVANSVMAKKSKIHIDFLEDTEEVLEVCLFDMGLMKTIATVKVYPKLLNRMEKQ